MNSTERMGYIVDYLTHYKQKIEALNKLGLFDTAVLYELFSTEICGIWFGQKFENLNSKRANYPYIDLISSNREIYVQVTTNQDIPDKIKNTLNKIKNSKSNALSAITELYFFVLDNESLPNVHDFSGDKKIGNIEFIAEKHLITHEKIINKAKLDIDFQIKLYQLFEKESTEFPSLASILYQQIVDSKEKMSVSIDCLIHGEYQIDRTTIIEKIKDEGGRFITILGEAGSGKSALCKMVIENEEHVLYARAECLAEENSINDIWKLDIHKTLKYLNGKKIVFFIDALEFIADVQKSKFELLQQLYFIASKYDNVCVFTTCRTCDYPSFIKISAQYDIKQFVIPELSAREIIDISEKYAIIKKLLPLKSYARLLRTPFYINLIVDNVTSLNDIKNEADLRDFIWRNIICLENRKLPYEIDSLILRKTVQDIVFSRAKSFSIGVKGDGIDKKILSVLLSASVIIKIGNMIRLKYDIYEDICFEHFFDLLFEECKGNYHEFYTEISSWGNCVYRRYQIWIENKLFVQTSRDKFLYNLIATKQISGNWRQQTLIGITKSRFCEPFFEEYRDYIIENALEEFLLVINTYAFEPQIVKPNYDNDYTLLTPVGQGRCCIIQFLLESGKYKQASFMQSSVRICSDYARTRYPDQKAAVSACTIMEYYVDQKLGDIEVDRVYSLGKVLNDYLLPIYMMAQFSFDWLSNFFMKISDQYIQNNQRVKSTLKEIIEYVLKHTTPVLAQKCSMELCKLANAYWISESEEEKTQRMLYNMGSFHDCREYGLNKEADNYEFDFKSANENLFFKNLSMYNISVALNWAIDFTNHAAKSYAENDSTNTHEISIWFASENQERRYIGRPEFWLAGVEENKVPFLIGDIIYLLKNSLIDFFSLHKEDTQLIHKIGNHIKSEIIEKSNNIMMLTIIESIGFAHRKLLPGYAVDLLSSVEILRWDLHRYSFLNPSEYHKLLEKQIFRTMNMPAIEKRYKRQQNDISLETYALMMQVHGGESIRKHIELVLDHLYSITPDDKDHAEINLLIQKMDLRGADEEPINEQQVALIPKLSGEAERVYNDYMNTTVEHDYTEKKEIEHIFELFNQALSIGTDGASICLECLEKFLKIIESSNIPFIHQREFIALIAGTLTRKDLDIEQRSNLCETWIDGIYELMNNESCIFDTGLSILLFKQVESDIDLLTSKRLKRLMLDCLLYKMGNGIIHEITNFLKEYLKSNFSVAKALFHTIIALAEEKMKHYLFDLNYRSMDEHEFRDKNEYERDQFVYYIDKEIKENGETEYIDKKEDIIEAYLFNDESLNLTLFNINEYDFDMLCYVSNCGLSLYYADFYKVMNAINNTLVNRLSNLQRFKVDFYSRGEVSSFFQETISSSDNIDLALDILFKTINFDIFKRDTFEYYENIFSKLHTLYFDSFKSPADRNKIMKKMKAIEKRLDEMHCEDIRKELSRIMFLSATTFSYADGNKYPAAYSYHDKQFLNEIWSKYGPYHIKNLLDVIYHMHIKELLPEILVSVAHCFNESSKETKDFAQVVNDDIIRFIINELITKAIVDYSDKIKQDEELNQAYENILNHLIDAGVVEAGVLLDEYRVH